MTCPVPTSRQTKSEASCYSIVGYIVEKLATKAPHIYQGRAKSGVNIGLIFIGWSEIGLRLVFVGCVNVC